MVEGALLAVAVCCIAVALGMAFNGKRTRRVMMAVGEWLTVLLPPW